MEHGTEKMLQKGWHVGKKAVNMTKYYLWKWPGQFMIWIEQEVYGGRYSEKECIVDKRYRGEKWGIAYAKRTHIPQTREKDNWVHVGEVEGQQSEWTKCILLWTRARYRELGAASHISSLAHHGTLSKA
jgi:hypothetical protein